MPSPPLSHHEILGLVGPFSRSGRQVDLAASDRLARRLVFKPIERSGGDPGPVASSGAPTGTLTEPLTETLQLDLQDSGHHKLTRVLQQPGGLQATLQVTGERLDDLLARLDAVPPARQFESGAGWAIARSYTLPASAHAASGPPVLNFTRGEARVDGLAFVLAVMDVKNVAGDIALRPAPGEPLALPEDLLAVIGWNWARLVPAADGWTSKLRLRGRGPQRSAAAEQALGQAARHLARVLAEPPARFHAHWRAARWGVVLRRAIPSLTAIGLVAGALLLPQIGGPELSGVWMALHYVPIGLLALSFTLQELPRFEIPPLPRRLRAAQWRAQGPISDTTRRR